MSEGIELPELPNRDILAQYLGKMLLARGIGLSKHGEPWQLVQLTEPSETGTLNEVPIMAFEVLFLTPEERESGTYVFTNESNGHRCQHPWHATSFFLFLKSKNNSRQYVRNC